ncbi:unnamed protein product [Sphenostylis stenocarpa]|uniref:Uncharacterized protein n=1 Tax=Sphenostylis stenocarpa TaxID=92480 RepID=A0AA86S0H0_9FABA|nr:unnamed protein product [Sphenostylis stenocarpa]
MPVNLPPSFVNGCERQGHEGTAFPNSISCFFDAMGVFENSTLSLWCHSNQHCLQLAKEYLSSVRESASFVLGLMSVTRSIQPPGMPAGTCNSSYSIIHGTGRDSSQRLRGFSNYEIILSSNLLASSS